MPLPTPAARPQAIPATGGRVPPRASAITSPRAPAAWLQKATVSAGRRRDWMPPKKSAAPQHNPELSPSGTPRFTDARRGTSAGDGAPAVAPARGVLEAGTGVDGEQERGHVDDEQTEHEPKQFHLVAPGF